MSNYTGFDVAYDKNDGSQPTLYPGQTVHAYDVTNSAALPDVAAGSDGRVPNGTLAVAAGTHVRFYFVRADGVCGFVEKVTT